MRRAEVTALSALLQAPVLAYRRGRGVLDSRDPLSVTLPLGRDLWGEADVVLAVGTRLLTQLRQWGVDRELAIIRVDADPKEHDRLHKPAVALTGDAKPILQALLAELPAHTIKRPSRKAEMQERQAAWRKRLEKLTPQIAYLEAIRDELPEDGIFVDEVTQVGFAARLLLPVYKPRTFLSPGYQDNLGWGFATALGAQHARPDVPVVAISGDGGFMFTANELATAMRHRIPLVTVVFNDGAFGNVRRIQQEQIRQSPDRQRSRQSRLRPLRRKFWRRGVARHEPAGAARRAAAGLGESRRPDAHRSPGRGHAEPLGIHLYAQDSRPITPFFEPGGACQRGLATGGGPEPHSLQWR